MGGAAGRSGWVCSMPPAGCWQRRFWPIAISRRSIVRRGMGLRCGRRSSPRGWSCALPGRGGRGSGGPGGRGGRGGGGGGGGAGWGGGDQGRGAGAGRAGRGGEGRAGGGRGWPGAA